MFVGRERELAVLEEAYASDSFQMAVLYGRRRVGKTALLERFAQGKRTLFFTAQLQADIDNLRDFSRAVTSFLSMPEGTPPFATWLDALEFVAQQACAQHLVFVFDELPYAARSHSALPSALQIAIDRHFSKTNCLMILCGSNQGFMEEEVLGAKSPLYGRRTLQMKLRPFDYLDAARLMGDCPAEDKVSYYASLGGTPYYLSAIRTDLSYVENMERLFFTRTGLMFDEPNMLLRQELREPAVYSSVMRAIAAGANRMNEIADRSGIAVTSVMSYLKVLTELDLVGRVVPFGEPKRSRKSLYRIKDPAFLFWFHFVAPYVTAVEGGLGTQVARRLLDGDRRSEYEGHLFEKVCREWLLREAGKGALPIQPTVVSSWWGTDPSTHSQTDIDVVAADEIGHQIILGECKWRNQVNASEVLNTLCARQHLIPGYHDPYLYLFLKRPPTSSLQKEGLSSKTRLITLDNLYNPA